MVTVGIHTPSEYWPLAISAIILGMKKGLYFWPCSTPWRAEVCLLHSSKVYGAADADAATITPTRILIEAYVVEGRHRLPCLAATYRILCVKVELTGFLTIEVIVGIEVLSFSGKLYLELRGVKMAIRTRSTHSVNGILPRKLSRQVLRQSGLRVRVLLRQLSLNSILVRLDLSLFVGAEGWITS